MHYVYVCDSYIYQHILTHWGRDKMDAISQTPFSSAFSWMKIFEFRLKFHWVPKSSINNIPALVQIMAWRRPGDKPLSEPMMVNLPTHICVTRPQWVKALPGPKRSPHASVAYSKIYGNGETLYFPYVQTFWKYIRKHCGFPAYLDIRSKQISTVSIGFPE